MWCVSTSCRKRSAHRKAYHMLIASITASVTHSSWLPFLMNLNRAILFYVCSFFFSVGRSVSIYTHLFFGFWFALPISLSRSFDGPIFLCSVYSLHTFCHYEKRVCDIFIVIVAVEMDGKANKMKWTDQPSARNWENQRRPQNFIFKQKQQKTKRKKNCPQMQINNKISYAN